VKRIIISQVISLIMTERGGIDLFLGRKKELENLGNALNKCISGTGSVILISGERGIGKTSLMNTFKDQLGEFNVLASGTDQDSAHPFILFSRALQKEGEAPLFHNQEYSSFAKIFAINSSGLLLAHASPVDDDLDADIFAGMLSAIQNFVKDSFDTAGNESGLGKLEYGDMKILIEHGQHLFLTGVFRGNEHRDMHVLLKNSLARIEKNHEDMLKNWNGNIAEMQPVQETVTKIAAEKFLVKRDLEGIKLSNERVKIADRVLDMLNGISEHKPVILMLEDLQWADESSLFVLGYLARNISAMKTLIVCTMRGSESAVLDKTVTSMSEEGSITQIELKGLEIGLVKDLAGSVCTPNDFSDSFIEKINEKCQGNPLFVIETVRQMTEADQIVRERDIFTLAGGDISIPGSIEDIIQKRLELLESDAMALSEYASCIGRVFETEAVLSIELLAKPQEAFLKIQSKNIVIRGDEASEFTHGIYQEIIYRDIGQRWKTSYHKLLGQYFETAYEHYLDSVIYQLAKH